MNTTLYVQYTVSISVLFVVRIKVTTDLETRISLRVILFFIWLLTLNKVLNSIVLHKCFLTDIHSKVKPPAYHIFK